MSTEIARKTMRVVDEAIRAKFAVHYVRSFVTPLGAERACYVVTDDSQGKPITITVQDGIPE
jgi:hypothetical protein